MYILFETGFFRFTYKRTISRIVSLAMKVLFIQNVL